MKLLVSACLLGEPCRYNGKGFDPSSLLSALSAHTLVPICPELCGGLGVPRSPCERRQDRVLNKEEEDVTDAFLLGAKKALAFAQEQGCCCALLKERSPTCGSSVIYDGSFTGIVIPGEGVATELLRKNGITVFSEQQTDALLSWIASHK